MCGKQGNDICVGSSYKNACFTLRVMGWMSLRGNGDLDRQALGTVGADLLVDGGEKTSGVVGAVRVWANDFA